ncbi:uncharacterized protein GIQ15_03723 [Arthroderma uncinatum]|uniref:uncharacterized protein n=1 Tax=Arthroderma uncinatum TaxID=74035 RepID=UPI00144AD764|nr:uncharacterized protein GIQ15_03723 [Arthroderma uncinatum]KAF3484399.1 hypothetical protein GIQ15_03723 [Arthroderma uncinatum]
MRGFPSFSSRASSKRQSFLRFKKRKVRMQPNKSSSSSSADCETTALGCAEASLNALFAATTLTRVPSKGLDSDKIKATTKKKKKKDNPGEILLVASTASKVVSGTVDMDAKAEKLSQMHPSARNEYAALRKEHPKLPEEPDLRAGILLLVTESSGEVKIGKCDGEPGCEPASRIGSLKRKKKSDL